MTKSRCKTSFSYLNFYLGLLMLIIGIITGAVK
jgi:hypothetical protein